MRLGQRRPHRRDDRSEPGLPQREDVGVSLDDDRAILLRDLRAGSVEAVEEVALAEELALGRVDVLRLQRVVVVELARLEAAHAAARVGEREDDPALEVVVAAAVREADREELLLRVALLPRAAGELAAAGRVADAELAADLLAEAARREVLARGRADVGVPQHTPVELGGALEQRAQPLVARALTLVLGRALLVLELDVEPPREHFDRVDEVDAVPLHEERDRVAALAAAEALERAARGRDREARRALLVEGTQPLVRAARLSQPHRLLDDAERFPSPP